MTPRKILPRIGLFLLVLLVVDQVALYSLLGDDELLGRKLAPFDPPLFTEHQRRTVARIESQLERGNTAQLAERFDADLGWSNPPNGGQGEFRYDWAGCRIGARPLSREKTPGLRRVMTLGCSLTHGEEVGALETWPAILDELRDDIEVANLGVAAYGLDQALMRYRRDGVSLEPDEVWLGLLPTAALRSTTLFRPLLRHWALATAFKPRFVLGEEDQLVRVDNPARSLEQVVGLLSSQEEFLAAVGARDYWVERAPTAYAPRGSHWLHHSFAGRLLLTVHEALDRDYPAHYARTGGETMRLMEAIIRATEAEARAGGASFRFLILPGEECLEYRDQHGQGFWQGLCDDLASSGIEVIDLCDALESSGLSRAEMYETEGHFSPAANRVIAETLAR